MSAGAFSDDKVVKAAEKIVCVFVDCAWGKKCEDLAGENGYKVEGYPTVVFADPTGKELSRDPQGADAYVKAIEEAAKTAKPAAYAESWPKALEAAKTGHKPIVYVFVTAKNDSVKLEASIADELLKELREKFVFVRGEIKKDNADAKKFGVSGATQPMILILNADDEKPEAKPIAKLTGYKSAKELKAEFEKALKKFEGGK